MTAVPSSDASYTLRLCEDTLPAGGRGALGALNRVLYARRGSVTVASAPRETRLAEGEAWYGARVCQIVAGDSGGAVLRFELVRGATPFERLAGGATNVLLEHAIDLDPRAEYLMRADRVDFAPGSVALPHRHRGGGIRCLIAGALEVTVGEGPARKVTPGGTWFESGREPVLAVASRTSRPASFASRSSRARSAGGRPSCTSIRRTPSAADRGPTRCTWTSRSSSPDGDGGRDSWSAFW